MGSEKYDLKLKSLYNVFNSYTKEEINTTIDTFQKAFNSIKLLKKKYGPNYDGIGGTSLISYMDEYSLKSFLSRIDSRLKCIAYLLRSGTTQEEIIKTFKNKDDNQINIILRAINEKIDGKKEEEPVLDTLEKIYDYYKITEEELLDALNLIEDNDRRQSFILSYGLNFPKLTVKEITKKLQITKNRFEKNNAQTLKELSRLIERSKHKKEFKKIKLELKKKEELESIKNTSIEEKKEEIVEEEPLNEVIEEQQEDKVVEDIPKEEIVEEIITETVSIELKKEDQDIITTEQEKELEEVVENNSLIEPTKEEIVEPKINTEIESSNQLTNNILSELLLEIYLDEKNIDDIENLNIDTFKRSLLIIFYYVKNNDNKIANLYINYLQERYKNNNNYLEVINKIVIIINAFNHELDVDEYEKILLEDYNKKPVNQVQETSKPVIEQEKIIDTSNKEDEISVIESKEEVIKDLEPVEEIKEEPKEVVKLQTNVELSSPNLKLEETSDLVLYEPVLSKEKKYKKHIKTIKDVLYDDITIIEQELYVSLQNPSRQHDAIKAWDILERLTCKDFNDKEALKKVINILQRLDDESTPSHIKGLKFPSNYLKYIK